MSLAAKIHAVRSSGLAVEKTGQVPGKFKFVSFPDVWSALLPKLNEHDLSVGFLDAALRFDGDREVVRLTLEIGDGAESRAHTYDMMVPEAIRNQSGSAVTNAAQRTANAITYAKRISLIAYFNIASGTEDDVERMTPGPGQSNIPGLILMTAATRWQDLTDGVWSDAMSPLEDGKLGDHAKRGDDHMRELWRTNVGHPGMCAWGADWIVAKMQETGMSWADVRAVDADMPEHMANCSPRHIRKAAAFLAGNLKPKA